MDTPDSARSLVHALVSACNSRDAERLAALCAPNCVGLDIAELGPQYDLEAMRRSFSLYLRAFPDVRFTVEQIVAQEGGIAVRWSARAAHRGTWMHIPPTGRQVTVSGMSMLSVEGGRVYRAIHQWDVAGLLRCLGLLPELSLTEQEAAR